MVVLQLILSWEVLDACVIVILKVPQSSSMLSIQHFGGLPACLIPCTPSSNAIFRHLPSFILITWPKHLKHCFISCSLLTSADGDVSECHCCTIYLFLRNLLRPAISNTFSRCSEERFIVQVSVKKKTAQTCLICL